MRFSSYFVLSTLVVAGVVAHAYVAHEQFYPAVVYLSTDKMCLAVMYNFAFAMFLLFGKLLLRVFIGTLRDLEVEQLVDSGRGFLADTILFLVFYAPTIDNKEVGTVYLIQYICCVIFMKVFHLTTQIRVSHMFEVGVPRLIVNIKLVALMVLLLSCDFLALQYFYSVASRSSTFFTWILFEALSMSTVVVVSICKYLVHMVDIRLDNGWPGKSVCLFYIDLIHDVVSMTLFLVFMLTFFVQNPSRLPIYMMADVVQVARKLAQRLRSFRRYRRISLTMELRFPDATDEELEENEHCVICRDSLFEGSKPKKLTCGHIFHIDCLRSWLVMQQVCPTCRSEIPADGPIHPAAQEVSPPPARPQGQAAASPTLPMAPPPPERKPEAERASPELLRPATSSSSAAPATAKAAPSSQAAVPKWSEVFQAPWVPVAKASGRAQSSSSTAMPDGPSVMASLPAAAALSMAASLPPIEELLTALQRAERVAEFLRDSTDFWCEQVRLEQEELRAARPSGSGASAGPSSLLNPPLWPFTDAAAAAQASSSAAEERPVSEAPAASSPNGGPSDEASRAPPSPGGGDLDDALAEIRRVQKEQWERKRTMSRSLSSAGPADSASEPAGS